MQKQEINRDHCDLHLNQVFLLVSNGINHSPPTLNGAPSPPQRFSNGPASSTSSALTNQQLPATCGARQLSKLKRFLTTLQQFGNDISPEIGEKVRTLVLALVVSTASLSTTVLSMWLRTEANREIYAYFSSFPNLQQCGKFYIWISLICKILLNHRFQLWIMVINLIPLSNFEFVLKLSFNRSIEVPLFCYLIIYSVPGALFPHTNIISFQDFQGTYNFFFLY